MSADVNHRILERTARLKIVSKTINLASLRKSSPILLAYHGYLLKF